MQHLDETAVPHTLTNVEGQRAVWIAGPTCGFENKLHRAFAERRVNVVNMRKEYFRVTLDEIRAEVEKLHGLVTFLLVPEAEEYRKTIAAALIAPEERGVVDPSLGAATQAEQE